MSSSELRQALSQVDGSAETITRAAGAMLRHYDETALVAVTEWRNAMQAARRHQLIPLVYVANEVLQNSKRNRGSNFLKAFAPDKKRSSSSGGGGAATPLGSALRHVCAADRSLTEKVRRTVKIWGDRSIYSPRFVSELLAGLEEYRAAPPPSRAAAAAAPSSSSSSRLAGRGKKKPSSPSSSSLLPTAPVYHDEDDAVFSSGGEDNDAQRDADDDNDENNNDATNDGHSSDDIMDMLEKDDDEDSDDDDDDDDVFGNSQGSALLKIDIDVEKAAEAAAANHSDRRSSLTSTGSDQKKRHRGGGGGGASNKRKRRGSDSSSFLGSSGKRSATDLLELWTRARSLEQDFDLAQLALDNIAASLEEDKLATLSDLVGDELLQAYRQTLRDERLLVEKRKELRRIAEQRRKLQQEAASYLTWLQSSLQHDQKDLALCDALEAKIFSFAGIHKRMRAARVVRLQQEKALEKQRLEQARKKKEMEETQKFRQAALQKQTEGGAGMVWNPTTREYQPLDVEESWRD